MFNPLTPSQVMLAVGAVLKSAASTPGHDDFSRSQLLSAYSVSRHLAAEQEAAAPLRRWFLAELDHLLERAGEPASRYTARVRECQENEEIGEIVSELLGELRSTEASPQVRGLSAELRRVLRELCNREVAALADPGSARTAGRPGGVDR